MSARLFYLKLIRADATITHMNYFLAKTDPQTYSIDDLKREGTTHWDGVHNYTAIAVIKSWKVGDRVFIYHSQGQAAIVGMGEVVSVPKKDENDPRGISWVADVRYICTYPADRQVTLRQVKESGLFADFPLVRLSRLSTMACTPEFTKWVLERVGSTPQ